VSGLRHSEIGLGLGGERRVLWRAQYKDRDHVTLVALSGLFHHSAGGESTLRESCRTWRTFSTSRSRCSQVSRFSLSICSTQLFLSCETFEQRSVPVTSTIPHRRQLFELFICELLHHVFRYSCRRLWTSHSGWRHSHLGFRRPVSYCKFPLCAASLPLQPEMVAH